MMAKSSPDYAIDVQGMNKRFGNKHVVKDVWLRVRRGEIFGFLGPNGSGKSTLVHDILYRALANLLRNAARYAGDAGPISVKAWREQDIVYITVSDQGPGVASKT